MFTFAKSNIYRMKKFKIFHLVGHVIFWLITTFAFTHYSYVRPMLNPFYMELIIVFLLAVTVYIHYFLLIPHLFQRKMYVAYWSITLIIILLQSSLEICLSYDKLRNIYEGLGIDLFHHYLRSLFIMISLRNAEFWAFFFILRLNVEMKTISDNKEYAILKEAKIIAVFIEDNQTITLKINDLSYIQCTRNKCKIHTKKNIVYEQYASLIHWEELLKPYGAVRVNRDTLIMMDAVVAFTCDRVQLIPSGVNVNYYKGDKQDEVFRYLCERLPSKQIISRNDKEKVESEGKNGSINDEYEKTGSKIFVNLEEFHDIITNDKEMICICRFIGKNSCPNAKMISDALNVPYRTLARKLKYLKNMNIIQYQGAKKNGGYVISPQVSEELRMFLMD